MKHDILGDIKRSDDDGEATIQYEGRAIDILLSAMDEDFDLCVQAAVAVVLKLGDLDRIAKRMIVAGLTENYNCGWNERDEVQSDGSIKRVVHPELSEADFEKKLALEGVVVTGSDRIDLYYDDSDLFWGHGVVVTSHDGTDFSNATAYLCG